MDENLQAPHKFVIEKLGGAQAVADMLGLTLSAVQHWKEVPSKHVLRLAVAARIDPLSLRPEHSVLVSQAPAPDHAL